MIPILCASALFFMMAWHYAKISGYLLVKSETFGGKFSVALKITKLFSQLFFWAGYALLAVPLIGIFVKVPIEVILGIALVASLVGWYAIETASHFLQKSWDTKGIGELLRLCEATDRYREAIRKYAEMQEPAQTHKGGAIGRLSPSFLQSQISYNSCKQLLRNDIRNISIFDMYTSNIH